MQQILTKDTDNINIIFSDIQNNLEKIIQDALNQTTDIIDRRELHNARNFIDSISKRKNEFEHNTGFKETSNTIEFAYFNELVRFILENKTFFNKIFYKSPRSYDFLTRLTHLEQKNNQNLTISEKDEIIGMGWYILKEIEEYNIKDESKILSYSIDLSFDSFTSYTECINNAKKWFEKIQSKSNNSSEILHPNIGRMYRLDYQKGAIFVTNPIKKPVRFADKQMYSARIRIISNDLETLDLIQSIGNHSYWSISWTIKDELSLKTLRNAIDLLHNDTYEFNNDFINWGGIEYTISHNPNTLITMVPEHNNEIRIRLVKKNSYFNKGFLSAHNIFSPKIIYEILLKLRKKDEVKSMINHCLY